MNLRDYIVTYGAHFGLVTFLLSIILIFTGNKTMALILDSITLLTLRPYVFHNSYWEERSNYAKIPMIWFTKFGTVISLISIINLIWYTFLVYLNTKSIILTIGSFLFLIILFPTILSYLMIEKNEYE